MFLSEIGTIVQQYWNETNMPLEIISKVAAQKDMKI